MTFKTTILWGESPGPGDAAKTYEFETAAELSAFIQGVEEASGWMNYSFEDEGFVVPKGRRFNVWREGRATCL